MKIDNKDDYDRLTGQMIIMAFIFFSLIAFSAIYDILHDYLIPIPSWTYTVFFIFLFLVYMFIRSQRKYYFIIYDDEEENNFILLKYYPMIAFNPKHQMLKIPKQALYKVETKKSFFNLKDELILYQTIKSNIAKYKPISITALNRNDKKNLLDALNRFAKVKMNA
jgi:hypothetical protein